MLHQEGYYIMIINRRGGMHRYTCTSSSVIPFLFCRTQNICNKTVEWLACQYFWRTRKVPVATGGHYVQPTFKYLRFFFLFRTASKKLVNSDYFISQWRWLVMRWPLRYTYYIERRQPYSCDFKHCYMEPLFLQYRFYEPL